MFFAIGTFMVRAGIFIATVAVRKAGVTIVFIAKSTMADPVQLTKLADSVV